MEEVEFLCPRVGIMDLGRIIALGTQGELRLLVGEKDSLRIYTQTLIPINIKEEIAQIEGVSEVRIGENFIGVLSSRGRRTLPAILDLLHDREVKVKSVEIKEPNLENVFLHLTGKELRE
jgi:ABC-2 type transport system ATP-binding protein